MNLFFRRYAARHRATALSDDLEAIINATREDDCDQNEKCDREDWFYCRRHRGVYPSEFSSLADD